MASLRHPNLVTVYDMLMDEDDLLLVMEYVRGQTLADVLASAPLGWERTLELLEPVAAALDHVHGRGVVHRDLKPSNILVGADGRGEGRRSRPRHRGRDHQDHSAGHDPRARRPTWRPSRPARDRARPRWTSTPSPPSPSRRSAEHFRASARTVLAILGPGHTGAAARPARAPTGNPRGSRGGAHAGRCRRSPRTGSDPRPSCSGTELRMPAEPARSAASPALGAPTATASRSRRAERSSRTPLPPARRTPDRRAPCSRPRCWRSPCADGRRGSRARPRRQSLGEQRPSVAPRAAGALQRASPHRPHQPASHVDADRARGPCPRRRPYAPSTAGPRPATTRRPGGSPDQACGRAFDNSFERFRADLSSLQRIEFERVRDPGARRRVGYGGHPIHRHPRRPRGPLLGHPANGPRRCRALGRRAGRHPVHERVANRAGCRLAQRFHAAARRISRSPTSWARLLVAYELGFVFLCPLRGECLAAEERGRAGVPGGHDDAADEHRGDADHEHATDAEERGQA